MLQYPIRVYIMVDIGGVSLGENIIGKDRFSDLKWIVKIKEVIF